MTATRITRRISIRDAARAAYSSNMPRVPDARREAIIRSLPAKTGRTIHQWAEHVRSKAPAGSREERIAWLEREHRIGHGQASTIVDWVDQPGAAT
jgi:hypothetical protein